MADTATATTTLTYQFLDGTVADTIDVDITIPAIDTGPYSGNGFVVTGITGSLGSSTITGEVGSGGTVQHDSSGYGYDNTIFASSPNGDGGSNGIDGNTDGIDGEGLEFTAAGHQYNIRTEAGAFTLSEEGVNAPAGQPLTFVSMTAPTETFTYQFLDASSGPLFRCHPQRHCPSAGRRQHRVWGRIRRHRHHRVGWCHQDHRRGWDRRNPPAGRPRGRCVRLRQHHLRKPRLRERLEHRRDRPRRHRVQCWRASV